MWSVAGEATEVKAILSDKNSGWKKPALKRGLQHISLQLLISE